MIEVLLAMEGLHKRMLKRFLSNCLWQITQAQGKTKYDIRYWTNGALELVDELDLEPRRYRKHLRHEHVCRRKDMVQKLIDRPADARRIARAASGCVVTIEEHQQLDGIDQKPKVDGWKRYKRAGLIVIDRKTGRERRTPRRS